MSLCGKALRIKFTKEENNYRFVLFQWIEVIMKLAVRCKNDGRRSFSYFRRRF